MKWVWVGRGGGDVDLIEVVVVAWCRVCVGDVAVIGGNHLSHVVVGERAFAAKVYKPIIRHHPIASVDLKM